MTNTAEQETTQGNGGRRPTHVAYWVRDRENKKSEWRPVGVAWTHADGKGFSVSLDLMPLDRRITLRAISDERKEDHGQG
jgi:hypothetical protein